jgi:4-alpha-glucanotransferase
MRRRASGILLHVTSLPSSFGVGDLGPWAYRFADFLAQAKQSYWQILPLTPINPYHYSPYHSSSAFAGSPLLISPEWLVRDGYLERSDIVSPPEFPQHRVDFPAAISYKTTLLDKAFLRFLRGERPPDYRRFCSDQAHWLDDFALFSALVRSQPEDSWCTWPVELRDRHSEALDSARVKLAESIEKEKFLQFLFFDQWLELKRYVNNNDIQLIGDIPVYVDYNSADVWSNPGLFRLDENRRPIVVAGVPPDYFSETGQLWGHPIYNWQKLQDSGYAWWLDRIGAAMALCDINRIDHFRGLVAYWEVPGQDRTALNGRWVEAPVCDFFNAVMKKFSALPIIAEDLGVITPDVREMIRYLGVPGMKILLFAFGPDLPSNPYAPHHISKNCIAYTGTHDNNTVRGWFDNEATADDKRRLFRYLGREVQPDKVPWEMIRLAMMSPANTAIFPLQDLMGLGQEARMNLPSRKEGNWMWRFSPEMLTDQIAVKLRDMTTLYGRA